MREWHIFSTPLVIAAAVGLSALVQSASQGAWPPRQTTGDSLGFRVWGLGFGVWGLGGGGFRACGLGFRV